MVRCLIRRLLVGVKKHIFHELNYAHPLGETKADLLFIYIQNNYLLPETFGTIIYEHFLFDIPKLLDLCVLYGRNNRPLLTKMVGNIFEKQPKYEEDWEMMVGMAMESLSNVAVKVLREGGESGAVRLDQR